MKQNSLQIHRTNRRTFSIGSVLLAVACFAQWVSAQSVTVDTQLLPRVFREGEEGVIQLIVKNTGQSPVSNLRVTHRLPEALTLLGSTSSQGRCVEEGNLVSCRLGELAAGATATLSVTGKVTASLPLETELLEVRAQTVVTDLLKPILTKEQVIIIAVPLDFGDAPDAPYPTLLASNGARHRVGPLFLGNQIDAEVDGQPNAAATGDDINLVPDDEDGIRVLDPMIAGDTVRIRVRSSGVGRLTGWIDYNQNGVWENAERILNCVPVVAGDQQFTTVIPLGAIPGWSYARFRLASNCVNTVTGYVSSGEVEDYRFRIRPHDLGNDLRIVQKDGRPHLAWDHPEGVLQSASEPNGSYRKEQDLQSPVPLNPNDPMKFFRLGVPGGAVDFIHMLREADLVFEGTVTDIRYRQSKVMTPDHVSLPHTFVKFQVHHVLKGDYQDETICLRFLGGPGADGRVLKASHVTLFDVGERSLLFVRRNGRSSCPLVGACDGRFRVHDGQVFSEAGRPLLWTSEGQIDFGPSAHLDEVRRNHIGTQEFEDHQEAEQSAEEPARRLPIQDGTPMQAEEFRNFLQRVLGHLPASTPNPKLDRLLSCDPDQPFIVNQPKAVAPRNALRSTGGVVAPSSTKP